MRKSKQKIPSRLEKALHSATIQDDTGCLVPINKLPASLSFQGNTHTIGKLVYCLANNIPLLSIDRSQVVRRICTTDSCLNPSHYSIGTAGNVKASLKEIIEGKE